MASHNRAAVDKVVMVAGVRTPFAKQLTHLRKFNAIELGIRVVTELIARTELEPDQIDQLIFGQVVMDPSAPNIAREIVLGADLPASLDCYSLSRACASSFQSVINGAQAIQSGAVQTLIAGGSDSTSCLPIGVHPKLGETLLQINRARSLGQKLSLLAGLRPRHLLPVPPAVRDYSTGLRMGDAAEQMARDHGISREAQDQLAHASHCKAAQAWQQGWLDDEVVPLFPAQAKEAVHIDNGVRLDSQLEAYARLKPVFDREYGTITAANSSPLTDGASALMLMHEDRARQLGLEPLARLRSYSCVAIDARSDMLMGPAHATPGALQAAGVAFKDLSLIDMHEAFAAQVLCNLKAFADPAFGRSLGLDGAIGAIDPERFNVLGGSLAYGHPFAATGTRMITQTVRELRRRGGGLALINSCAAGGLGVAMVWEV